MSTTHRPDDAEASPLDDAARPLARWLVARALERWRERRQREREEKKHDDAA